VEATIEQQETTELPAQLTRSIELVDRTLRDISGTSIASTSVIVDVLLDLRVALEQLETIILDILK
jgi:hypothetical protein